MNSIEKINYNMSRWAYEYCRDVEDGMIIRQYITNPGDAFLYCEKIAYREEMAEIARQGGFIL